MLSNLDLAVESGLLTGQINLYVPPILLSTFMKPEKLQYIIQEWRSNIIAAKTEKFQQLIMNKITADEFTAYLNIIQNCILDRSIKKET